MTNHAHVVLKRPKKKSDLKKYSKKCSYNQQWLDKEKKCVDCPNGWVLLDHGCYYVSTAAKTWSDAQAFCRAQSSELFYTNSYTIVEQTSAIYDCFNIDNEESLWVLILKISKFKRFEIFFF